MERIQRVVEDFALLFLSKRDFRVNANQSPLRETYTQLVAIVSDQPPVCLYQKWSDLFIHAMMREWIFFLSFLA